MMPNEHGYTLPALPKPVISKELAGPTPWSNWVLPGQIIAGAYPASMDDEETEKILTTLLELGINTFVCLQAEVNIHVPEHAWRAGQGLRPYIRDAQKVLSKAHEARSSRITQQKIDFLHLPIIDGNVTTDNALSRLAQDCCERVLRGEKLYVHCWGGHGRTGTLLAVMVSWLYSLPYSGALKHIQAFHDSRVFPQGVRSPQTPVQRAQVRRILAAPPPPALVPLIAESISAAAAAPAYAPSTPTISPLVASPAAGRVLAPSSSRSTGSASKVGGMLSSGSSSKALLAAAAAAPSLATCGSSKALLGAAGRPGSSGLAAGILSSSPDKLRSSGALSLGSSVKGSRPSSGASGQVGQLRQAGKLAEPAGRQGHIPESKISSSSLAEGISKAASVGSSALDRLSVEFQKLKAGGPGAGGAGALGAGAGQARGGRLSYLLGSGK